MRKKKRADPASVTRYTPAPDMGLAREQVDARQRENLGNRIRRSTAKPTWRIFFDNICTFFNLIWAVIVGILIYLGAYDELLFIVVILANTVIAIVLELRAKITLEKLTLMTAPRVTAVRDGEDLVISADDLVLDDVFRLAAGDSVPADAILLDGLCEVNESMLTGESDAVRKAPGDRLFAGSFLISGGCVARADAVGDENYIQQVAARVKTFKAPQSYLFRDIRRIIRWIGIGIIPFSVIMYLNNYAQTSDVHDALLQTTGSLEGMIPAGMFLLITVAFSIGVLKLSARHTQVRDTYSIEMLSRTDTLCLDKTGTITDGTMEIVRDLPLSASPVPPADLIANILAAQSSGNFTSDALKKRYTTETALTVSYNIPFSSARKYTATAFAGIGTAAVGAPEFLPVGTLPDETAAAIATAAARGQRVLMLAVSPTETTEDKLPDGMTPVLLVFLEDHIREEAPATIAWFRENDVSVRVISGDNPVTVSAIAARVGVADAEKCVSLEGMSPEEVAAIAEDYTVFGRVTPDQKLALVRRLKQDGHVVSMTGDGVNDTMALKEADCSIAMAAGSEAARSLSNIVLQDNNFASLPAVVREGRQVVNNVQRSSTLFLMKTFFTIMLSLLCVLTLHAYPFTPKDLFLFETFVTGFPSVILALQPNTDRIRGRFISSVLRQCLPAGILLLLNVSLVMFGGGLFGLEGDGLHTLLCLILTSTAFINLVFLCYPFTLLRLSCVGLSFFGIIGSFLLMGKDFFGIIIPDRKMLLILLAFALFSVVVHILLTFIEGKILSRYEKKKAA